MNIGTSHLYDPRHHPFSYHPEYVLYYISFFVLLNWNVRRTFVDFFNFYFVVPCIYKEYKQASWFFILHSWLMNDVIWIVKFPCLYFIHQLLHLSFFSFLFVATRKSRVELGEPIKLFSYYKSLRDATIDTRQLKLFLYNTP